MNYSRQRQAIMDYLASTKDHPTAETIYAQVKKDNPKISLGTVYRNLNLLVEMGEIQKISTSDSFEHYDADTSSHGHYYCRLCHRVMDLDIYPEPDQILAVSGTGIGSVERASLLFTGICSDCSSLQ